MPTYRARDPDDPDGKTQGIVKHKLLPRPLTRTFDTRAEAEAYCKRLQQALDAGIVPAGIEQFLAGAGRAGGLDTLRQAMRDYETAVALKAHDLDTLDVLSRSFVGGARLCDLRLRDITLAWAEDYVRELKLVHQLTPGTIRKRVGTLRRLFDWLVRHRPGAAAVNAFASLPRNYSAYSEVDKKAVRKSGGEVPEDTERDRRVLPEEEEAVRLVLDGHVRPDRERAPDLRDAAELLLLFSLALETAMRLREMYTLTADQVDLARRTVFLDKTKNGDSRQVPLSTVAVAALQAYSKAVGIQLGTTTRKGTRRTGGALLFPLLFDGSYDRKALARTTSKVSRRFGWLFDYAGIEDLTFHDARHEATCRLYERTTLSDVQIARVTGHRDLRMLKRYASLRGSDLAPRLW